MIPRDGALTSLWQATTDTTGDSLIPNQTQSGDDPTDVVIVGGGITGITTALQLQDAGFKCVLLEANSLCFGTTGGTTAHISTLLDTPYPTIIKNFSEEDARHVARSVKDAIELIRKNIEEYGIDAGFEEQTAYLFSKTDEQTKELEEIRKSSSGVGLDLEYTEQMPIALERQKALAIYGQVKFHPTRYVMELAKVFVEQGGKIIENCRVSDADNNDTITVHTSQGDVLCRYLIYCTHIPPGINVLNTRCAPYRSYAIAVSLKGDYPDGLVYDMDDPYHYYRTQLIDGKRYLIAGGEDHKTGHTENTAACFLRLESHVRGHFSVDRLINKWSSQYFDSVDGLPYIGHLPGHPGNIFVATGFGGNGMVYSGVAALIFRQMLLNKPAVYGNVYDPNRLKPIAGFTNFVKENFDVAKQLLGGLLPAHKLESFSDMAAGEGRIVKIEGETVALYKNEHGELMALKPACTHMGCHVAWNSEERSWDCPCHGARYNVDGTVLTGPASKDLEPISIEKIV